MIQQTAETDSKQILDCLRPVRRLEGITGTVLATMDGRSVVTDLDETSPGSAAAIAASSLGLGARIGELTEPGAALLELQVRSGAGYVCLYVINSSYLVGVVTTHAVNLARLKLEMREVLEALDAVLPAAAWAGSPEAQPYQTATIQSQ